EHERRTLATRDQGERSDQLVPALDVVELLTTRTGTRSQTKHERPKQRRSPVVSTNQVESSLVEVTGGVVHRADPIPSLPLTSKPLLHDILRKVTVARHYVDSSQEPRVLGTKELLEAGLGPGQPRPRLNLCPAHALHEVMAVPFVHVKLGG